MTQRFQFRGQTLVVFALTLLLITLMVCMTLSIGTKVKEKMELETAADAAAYSQAVATARTYNSVAVLNRALMSNMVAMAGVQSLISWSSYYRAVLNETVKAYDTPKKAYEKVVETTCPPGQAPCPCAKAAVQHIKLLQEALKKEEDRVNTVFMSMDSKAGLEARALQISSVSDRQQELFVDNLLGKTLSGSLDIATSIAKEVSKGSKWGSDEVTALKASEKVNLREQDADQCAGGDGAACRRRAADHKNHFIWAAMGTRGYAFVTGRAGGAGPIKKKLLTIITPPQIFNVSNEGSGYFADGPNPTHGSKGSTGNEHAWGDDHGSVSVRYVPAGPCLPVSGSGEPKAHVRSNDTSGEAGVDQHQWSGGSDPGDRIANHTMGDCTLCPGMWPPHMDYNWGKLENVDDVYGQPKTYAVLQRDLNKRPPKQADPWNLLFDFKFSKNTSGEEFDNTGLKLSSMPGVNISQPTALSAGMAYYHRVSRGYQEPPNFLNPYWRATLVRADIDTVGPVDIVETLSGATNKEAKKAVEALDKAGYKAW
ncbi:MAG TPA: pilus assembly protein TadG-related protein [Myxococcaceae bacterium]|nr:pilus assembly protein TadG-related protein [Myxococcaceae bacterium]